MTLHTGFWGKKNHRTKNDKKSQFSSFNRREEQKKDGLTDKCGTDGGYEDGRRKRKIAFRLYGLTLLLDDLRPDSGGECAIVAVELFLSMHTHTLFRASTSTKSNDGGSKG